MGGVRRGVAWPEVENLLRHGVATQLPDRELLERFVSDPDRTGELAFTVLVARHGPMVLGVCRRILRDANAVDDAFQATFLVLARKAGSIRLGASLGPWLCGVSRRVARRLHDEAARRRVGLCDTDTLENVPDPRPPSSGETLEVMDLAERLEALPAPFRSAIRLCYLDGLTHEEAAERLGCPVGTVRSRLARGRALLREWLEGANDRPRPDPSFAPDRLASPSIVAPWLLRSTVGAGLRVAAGQSLAVVAPTRIANLVTGVLTAMSRTKIAVLLFLAAASLAGWAAWAGQPAPQAQPSRREVDQPPSDRLRGDFERPLVRLMEPRPDKTKGQKTSELPADFPAFVVETVPKLGDVDVDPETTREIRVIFSKPMMDKSWSWVTGNVYAAPRSTGDVHYLSDGRTCVMPVKLEPGKTYVVGINGGRYENFRDAKGRPAMAMTLAFRTRAAK